MIKSYTYIKKSRRAQTAMELAVFGAIVIFIIGVIIRQALGFGYQQNQSLKAMRLAMSLSYRYSEVVDSQGNPLEKLPFGQGTTSRNSATVLFIEDRLSPTADKFGSTDRTPYVLGGRGTFSNQLFQRITKNEDFNLPIFDVFVNGKHFPFQIARYRHLGGSDPSVEGFIPLDDTNPDWIDPSVEPCITITPNDGVSCPLGECSELCLTHPDAVAGCVDPLDCDGLKCDCTFDPDCDIASSPPYDVGCVAFWAVVPNSPLEEDWCTSDCGGGPGGGSCSPGECDLDENLSVLDRFDLDRDGVSDVDPAEYDMFAWQWKKVVNFNLDKDVGTATLNKYQGISMEDGENILVDIDGDLKEERIVHIQNTQSTGVINEMFVLDNQNADIDFTYNSSDYEDYIAKPTSPDTKPEPGLTNDTSFFTFVREGGTFGGTFLLIEEGKLFEGTGIPGDDRQYIRGVQKKDQVDLIQRVIQLSNNTGRFCEGPDGDGVFTPPEDMPEDPNIANPVEACDDCFSDTNIKLTCMDTTTLQLFVRSRVHDLHGRKWVMPQDEDDYVDYDVPGLDTGL